MSLADHFEGLVPLPIRRGADEMKCDFCTSVMEPGDSVTAYWCNVDYGPFDMDGDTLYRIYCEDCDRTSIQFPADDATEVVISARLGDGYEIEDVEPLDISKEGQGAKWNPPEMFKVFVGETPDDYMNDDKIRIIGAMGPEDVYDFFGQFGLDVSQIVNEEGYITADDSTLQEMRKRFHGAMRDELERRASG